MPMTTTTMSSSTSVNPVRARDIGIGAGLPVIIEVSSKCFLKGNREAATLNTP
jgi:hypothetical protein